MRLQDARILVCNDDGVNADGIKILEKIAKSLSSDVWVVAPENEKSASGHSLTLTVPLRVREVADRKYAINGTPTDSVLIAVKHIIAAKKPDLVLSGINAGGNLGHDISYSGTVAAALEAALLGIPAIALSQLCVYGEKVCWDASLHHAPQIISRLVREEWSKNIPLNVNFPNLPAGAVGRVEITSQGKRKLGASIKTGTDPRGHNYLWVGTDRDEDPYIQGSDLKAVNEGHISITPLCLDLTHYPTMSALRNTFP